MSNGCESVRTNVISAIVVLLACLTAFPSCYAPRQPDSVQSGSTHYGLTFREIPKDEPFGEALPHEYGEQGEETRAFEASDGARVLVKRAWFSTSSHADEVLAQELIGASQIIDPPDDIRPARNETDNSTYRAVAVFSDGSSHAIARVYVVYKVDSRQVGGREWSMIISFSGPSLKYVYAFEEAYFSEAH
jgi:hypothetical protein